MSCIVCRRRLTFHLTFHRRTIFCFCDSLSHKKGEGVAAFKRAGISFFEETKQFELRMAARQETKSGDWKGGEKTKEEARARGEAEMPALKKKKKRKKNLSYPECTFVLGGFLIALPWQPEQCWKALSLRLPAENDFLHHAFSKQLERQTRNLA